MDHKTAGLNLRVLELERELHDLRIHAKRLDEAAAEWRQEAQEARARVDELEDFQVRHQRLREVMERLLGEFDGFDLKSHYGECSPPTTDCDGDCATDAWLQGLLSDAQSTLAEDKDTQ